MLERRIYATVVKMSKCARAFCRRTSNEWRFKNSARARVRILPLLAAVAAAVGARSQR